MGIEELFTGIAVVIDDEIGKKDANINDLIQQIEDLTIPYISYKELPDTNYIQHFSDISFLLLDWRLLSEDLSESILEGVSVPAVASRADINANVEFLKRIKTTCFAPVFIFTDEDKDTVITTLRENGLFQEDKPNFILVRNKNDLKDGKLFSEIEAWLKTTPSIYVLKSWEKEYGKAKNRLFTVFYELSSSWPKILWDAFKADGVNVSKELGEVITRNLYTRMAPFSFDSNFFNDIHVDVSKEEVRSVLEGERFITSDQLHKDDIVTGDIFKEERKENNETRVYYFLNIRAQCDLVRASDPGEVELYCLKGRIVDESSINTESGYKFAEGQFLEKINHAVVSCIDNGKIIEFLFRDLKIMKWKTVRDKRIGCLLPPYINRIQQRYALYQQRQGLPRTPDAAILGTAETALPESEA
jgi:hypothetical protein